MSRQLKLFGLVALAALALGVNAVSASAKIAEFASEKYPANLTGTQNAPHTFNTKAGPLRCTTATFVGVLAAQAPGVPVTPTYGGCTLAGKPATFATKGCTYMLEAGLLLKGGEKSESMGMMQIVCPFPQEMLVTTKEGCEMKIPPTTEPAGFVDFKTVPFVGIEAEFNVEYTYTLNNKCGVAAGKYKDTMVGTSTIRGNNGPIGVL